MDYLDIAHCFGVIRRRSQAFVVEACEKLHLTYSEYALLLKLYDAEGCSQDDMAGMLYLDKAVVTRVIKTLEGKGFIYREQDDKVLLLAVFVLALPKTFAKTCSHVLPHNGLKFGTSQDAKL